MEINLDTLTLISYNDNDYEHLKFKKELLKDYDFISFFGEMFIKKADEIFSSSNSFELKKAYLVKDENKIVGMIRFYSYHESGTINIQYAIRPSERRKGYGTKLIKEVSEFLFANGINCIEGDINKNNIGSIKVANNFNSQKVDDKYKLRK